MTVVQKTAFDGAVTFHVRPRTLNNLVMGDLLLDAVPAAALFKPGSQSSIIFDNLGTFLAQTETIVFTDDVPPEAEGLRAFWAEAGDCTDYARLWLLFCQRVGVEAHNEWLDAVNSAIPETLRAPDVVRVIEDDDPNE